MSSMRGLWPLVFAPLWVACGLHPLPVPLLTEPADVQGTFYAAPDESFLAEARIDYFGQGQARKGKVTIMTAPEGRVRMDVLSFTDDLISVLAVKDGLFIYFERGQKGCLAGPFCAAPMVSSFPSLADPEKLAGVMQGILPLLPDPESQTLVFSRKEGVYILTLAAGDLVQEVRISPTGKWATQGLLKRGGKVILKVDFKGRLKVGQRTVPQMVRLRAPAEDIDLLVDFREAEYGYEFKGDPFSFKCPGGVDVQFLNCM
jgi:hypothetical protein